MNRLRPRPAGRPFTRYALNLWQRSPRGRRLLALEERELRRVLPDIFGRQLLQIGNWDRDGRLTASAATLHRATLGTHRGAGALVKTEQLPLLDKSIDAAVLPHSLEFSADPRALLREVNRVLNDRGTCVILGFNPWSAWGVRRWLGFRYPAFPEGARFFSAGRVCDWLELLDFEVSEVRRFGVGFPWLAAGEDSLFRGLNEAWLVVARKRVLPMNWVGRLKPRKVAALPRPAVVANSRAVRSANDEAGSVNP